MDVLYMYLGLCVTTTCILYLTCRSGLYRQSGRDTNALKVCILKDLLNRYMYIP